MVWFHIEDIWLGFPELFDGLVGCLEAQSLQLLGEVVSDEPVADMAAQFIDRRVTEGFDGGLLDGAHHPFGLAVGPWVIGLGEAMLDAVLLADTAEDMADPSQWAALVPLHELYAVAQWEAAYRRATMP